MVEFNAANSERGTAEQTSSAAVTCKVINALYEYRSLSGEVELA